MTLALLPLLVACGGEPPPAPAVPEPGQPWLRSVGTWYCGAEPVAAAAGAAGTRDFVVKLTPGEDSVVGIYGVQEGGRTYIGTLTRFAATGERAATFHAENSERQKGEARAAFSADFASLTLGWQVAGQAAPTDTVLARAADPTTCAAGALLR